MAAEMPEIPGLTDPADPGDEALDAYSRVVSSVAAEVSPHVASLRVTGRRPGGRRLGASSSPTTASCSRTRTWSAASGAGTAAFADGTESAFDVVGADPLSDLAVVRARGGTPRRPGSATPTGCVVGQLVVAVGNPLGLGGTVTAGRGQRAGPVAAHPQRPRRPGDRGRDPDRRRAQPGQLRRCAGRRHRPGGRHQHRGRRGRPRPRGAGQRDHPADRVRAADRRPGPPCLPRPGQRAGPAAGADSPSGSVSAPRCGWSRWSPAVRPPAPGSRPATSC